MATRDWLQRSSGLPISAIPRDLGDYSIVKERRYYTRLSRLSIESFHSASDYNKPMSPPYPLPGYPTSSQVIPEWRMFQHAGVAPPSSAVFRFPDDPMAR
jgi:hypothetical protein